MLALQHLGLPAELVRRLSEAGYTHWKHCSNLTEHDLMALDFNGHQAGRIHQYLDAFIARRFRKEMLCPHLPEACYWVELEALDLPEPLRQRLALHRVKYLYQLAFQRRPTVLKQWSISDKVVELLVRQLQQFIQMYRQGQIVLEEEN